VPVLFLTGPAASLFYPLALAVIFAMLASYLLSRTLVPTLVLYLLPAELVSGGVVSGEWSQAPSSPTHHSPLTTHHSPLTTVHQAFNRWFERFRSAYEGLLGWALEHRFVTTVVMLGFALGSLLLAPRLGEDFFPAVDAGQFRLHVRAPSGTRIEET